MERVTQGHTLVVGGWSNNDPRVYLLLTPVIQAGGDGLAAGRIALLVERRLVVSPGVGRYGTFAQTSRRRL